MRAAVPLIDDPGYVPALARLCEEHGVGAVLPLTDLDIEVLARAREQGLLPALVPSSEVARATYDKYETHLLLERHSLPSPPTVLPEADLEALDYPVMVKPRRGSGARSIHLARDPAQARFFIDYVPEPTMVQRAMGGPELSIDCLGDLERPLPERDPAHDARVARRRVDQGPGDPRRGADRAGPHGDGAPRRCAARRRSRCSATPTSGIAITDVNTRFGGAFPAPAYAALPGPHLPGADRARWPPARSPSRTSASSTRA